MLKRLDEYWYSRNPLAWLLSPLGMLYCGVASMRRFVYRIGLIRSVRTDVPVIVVGNITVGGTGKTPLLVALVDILKARGHRPGIISRGYAGQSSQWPQVVEPGSDPVQVGDEPVLLARRCQVPVVVGPDRLADAKRLLESFDCDLILSDDGLQHYRLQRDLEIAVIDAQRRLGNGFCLPAGPLRERPARLRSVDMIISNGGIDDPYYFKMKAVMAINVKTAEKRYLDMFCNENVHAAAGIGNPGRFFDTLKAYGLELIEHSFPDHHMFKRQDLEFDDALPVLITEKDMVKCRHWASDRLWYVPIDVELSADSTAFFSQLVDRLNPNVA